MKRSFVVMGALMLTTAAAGATAAEGKSSVLCAVTHTVACDSAGDCLEGPASAVNLPVFLRFDLDNNLVQSARQGGERRTSKVKHVRTSGDLMLFLGEEENGGWTATVNKSSGNFTGTMSEQEVGYLIFGSCLSE